MTLSEVKGVGAARLKVLKAAGIETARDLIDRVPVGYRDLSDVRPVRSLAAGESAAVRVRVAGGVGVRTVGKLTIVSAKLRDASGEIEAVWYNQPWLERRLVVGREFLLYGTCEVRYGALRLRCPSFETGGGLRPMYRAVGGIASGTYAGLAVEALAALSPTLEDRLPIGIVKRHDLCDLRFAYAQAHRPESRASLELARRRLAFEASLLHQVALRRLRGARGEGARIDAGSGALDAFWDSLPFAPTGAQRRVAGEIAEDMRAPFPMARMVQGDVGCGKTLIAFAAIYAAAQSGWQSALMAPTEVLAAQHFESARRYLAPLGVRVGLLTGGVGAKARGEAHRAIRSGDWDLAVGTHALITESVAYRRLGLAITDEQHRFGVRQRALLSGKGEAPNALVMSATPIPRSLSLILYGDLELSVVDESPPGRIAVRTALVREEKREAMYGFIREQIRAGRQAYIICPLVEESEEIDASDALGVYERLRDTALRGLRVALLHGRMSAEIKDQTLRAFRGGEIDALVSTTVVEVGVDAPNASVAVIENAERFGLSQLHQLRGRVGRGDAESWCFLMAEGNERLRILAETNDGFRIAQADLDARGPGDLLGYRQSGAPQGGIGDPAGDLELLIEAHEEAIRLCRSEDSDESRAVFAMADAMRLRRFRDVGIN